jgi:hypothetical protein
MLSGSRSKQEQIGYAGGFAQLSFTTTNANGNLKNHITRLVSYFQYYYHVSYVSVYNSTYQKYAGRWVIRRHYTSPKLIPRK